jgi:hypothetical protein
MAESVIKALLAPSKVTEPQSRSDCKESGSVLVPGLHIRKQVAGAESHTLDRPLHVSVPAAPLRPVVIG